MSAFTSSIDKNLMLACMKNNLPLDKDGEQFEKLMALIDEHHGAIFGSTMIAYMSKGELLKNDYRPRDIDVVFYDMKDYTKFNAAIKQVLAKSVNDSNSGLTLDRPRSYDGLLKYYRNKMPNGKIERVLCNRYTERPGFPYYSFSELLPSQLTTEEDDDTECKHDVRTFHPGYGYGTIHAIYLKPSEHTEKCAADPTYLMEHLWNNFFKIDFTKVVYYNGTVYSALPNFDLIRIRLFDMHTKGMTRMVRKYISGGMKFEIVDGSEATRVDRTLLRKAKNQYQSLGLVVIPLSKNDMDGAGKAPNVRDWQTKTSEFDFLVDRCDNIGIVCGPESGIVCIDVDYKDQGMFYFNKMIENYGMPECPTQRTPNGGRHYIFKYNPERMKDMTAKIKGARLYGCKIGVDLWIQNCQFVAEPSVNHAINREYTWVKPITSIEAVPELPEWIYTLYHTEDIDVNGNLLNYEAESSSSEEEEEYLESDEDTIINMDNTESEDEESEDEESEDEESEDDTGSVEVKLDVNVELTRSPTPFIIAMMLLIIVLIVLIALD